jgi:integrative and conjugative element protein (TIGR02256 family)
MKGQGCSAEHLTFVRSGSGYFQIGSKAFALMRHYVQDMPTKPEAGGVLLGRHILETGDIIVDRITEPMPSDRQSRFRFFRAQRLHQAAIDRAWRESGGTCTYLGEWHTHPEPHPTPSWIDWQNWQRKLRVDRFTEPIFFVIMGTRETHVWEGRRSSGLMPLHPF